METTGMTQGGQDDPSTHLEMDRNTPEEFAFKDESECMEEDQDSEV